MTTRNATIAKLEQTAERVAQPQGIEIVEVELKGSGRNQLLRVTIDKPAGVTHADCEVVSKNLSAILDQEDPIPGPYNLEVTSPGIERKLVRWQDWERFTGKQVKVVLKQPAADLKHFEGVISQTDSEARAITVELAGGRKVTFPLEQVDRANLRFEW